MGGTPYGAVQVQTFHTPSYSETDLTGGGFGLAYNAMNATDTRSELGARFDDATVLGVMPLVLRARTAWAHDWITNPALGAVFEALPGAAFTVNGAAAPTNSALASLAPTCTSPPTGCSRPSSTASSPRGRRPTPAPARCDIRGDRAASIGCECRLLVDSVE